MQYLLKRRESIFFHKIAYFILSMALCHIEGGYEMALYHTQRLLEPDSVKYREYMLTLYDAAQVIDRERAERIAREILERDESNRMAREMLERRK